MKKTEVVTLQLNGTFEECLRLAKKGEVTITGIPPNEDGLLTVPIPIINRLALLTTGKTKFKVTVPAID